MLCAFLCFHSQPGWIKLLLCLFSESRKYSFKGTQGQNFDLITAESEGDNMFLLVGLTSIDIISSLTSSLTRAGAFLNPLEHCVNSPRHLVCPRYRQCWVVVAMLQNCSTNKRGCFHNPFFSELTWFFTVLCLQLNLWSPDSVNVIIHGCDFRSICVSPLWWWTQWHIPVGVT